ncbi:hypothetical protein G5V58_19655 [Nocardioides anomalus]|uniref:LTD domain-containing protein n=1 Tax=Nocardioides anomalus TaxID=2712223 RepID=A0A6G6WL92_9ACTN|nr:hypothetical protein G5V58_19655 [Nocardioides anomalus]
MLALGVLATLPSPAHAADTDVKINEIESQDGFPDDWVELINTGGSPVDISSYVIRDSGNNIFTIPAGTTIQPGALFTLDVGSLGDSDKARFMTPGSASELDSFTWTSPAHGTYSRCPDGTGGFVDATPSKNSANVCGPASPWPGGNATAVADGANTFTVGAANAAGDDVSGLAYQAADGGNPATLWAVQNTEGTLYKLVRSGATWVRDTTYGTNGAKTLFFPGGVTAPDTEGLTLTGAGVAGGFFSSTEREAVSKVSRPSILQFVDGPGATLTAAHEWNLAADLASDIPVLDDNMALEGVTWVPDSYLTSKGFRTGGGLVYDPASYPHHGTGLFFVGVEQTGTVYAYALDLTGSAYTRVASFPSGFPSVMDLTYEPGTRKLWAVCDDTCGGRTATFEVNASGAFARTGFFERPGNPGSANLNNEGFAIAPQSECVNGLKPTFYADDSNTDGHVIRVGTLNCSLPRLTASLTSAKAKTAAGWYGAPVTVTFACTAGSLPLSGGCPAPVTLGGSGADQSVTRSISDTGGTTVQASATDIDIDTVAPTVAIKGVKKGKAYPKKKKPTCEATDTLSGVAGCTITQKKKGKKYVVTATATDRAGNTTTTTLTYKLKAKKKKK